MYGNWKGAPAQDGMKKCAGCFQLISVTNYYKDRHHEDGFRSRCKDCQRIKDRLQYQRDREKELLVSQQYRLRNPDYLQKYRMQQGKHERLALLTYRQRHNLTIEEAEHIRMLRTKTYCMICGKPAKESRKERLCLDHDHDTGRLRGLLCDNCNTALGLLKDNVFFLEKATDYLKNPPGIPKSEILDNNKSSVIE